MGLSFVRCYRGSLGGFFRCVVVKGRLRLLRGYESKIIRLERKILGKDEVILVDGKCVDSLGIL